MTDETPSPARRLGPWLIIGIIAAPAVFAWFTLRRGHTRSSRYAAFTHLALGLFVGVLNAVDQASYASSFTDLTPAALAPAPGPSAARVAPLGAMIDWRADRDGAATRYVSGAVTLTLSSRAEPGGTPIPTLTVESPGLPPLTVEGVEGLDIPAASFGVGTLDAGNPMPQVLFVTYSGGAHCCIEVAVLEARDARWTATTVGSWDGELTEFPGDIDGDGLGDIIRADNRFLYAFAPYALSMAPPMVLNVVDGKVRDVSDRPKYAALFKADMAGAQAECLKAGNGACAAFVADAARLGLRDWAWPIMLAHYDRASTWGLPEGCAAPRVKGACPEGREREPKDFPEALAWFLEDAGYFAAAPSPR